MDIYSVHDPYDNYRITHHVTDIDAGIKYFASLYPSHEIAIIDRKEVRDGEWDVHLELKHKCEGEDFDIGEHYFFKKVIPIV